MQDRLPPQNIEAEQAVLGALLIERDAIAKVGEFLREKDFYRESHKYIYRAILELFSKEEAVDIVTVVELLRTQGKLENADGLSYIGMLVNTVPSAANVLYYARIIEEKSLLRSLIYTATDIATMGYESAEKINVIIDTAEKKILEVANRTNSQEFSSIKDIIFDVLDTIELIQANPGKLLGISTGFRDLDKLINGLHKSDLILIAARPSMGKTAFVLNICTNSAIREKCPVAFFSLEMSKEQLVQRMICSEARIDSQKLKMGILPDNDIQKLLRAADNLAQSPIFIDETPCITAMELRSKVRRLKAQYDLQLVIIDYLQLMGGSGIGREENRQQQISEISRSLKSLAREINVPIIALSQLSRSVESRQNKKPMLSDLRESGSLEQDADIVMFLYREDYYAHEIDEKNNEAEIIIAKHRNGPTDTVKLFFHKDFTAFADIATRKEDF